MSDLRAVERLEADGTWTHTRMQHLHRNDMFRMFETDGDGEQLGPYVAADEPYLSEAGWTIVVTVVAQEASP